MSDIKQEIKQESTRQESRQESTRQEASKQEKHKFQRDLDQDREEKSRFVEAKYGDEDDSENSSDDSEDDRKILIPVQKKRHRVRVDVGLVERLVKQQKVIGKLQAENLSNEVILRFTKLDLNNAQVQVEETKKKYGEIVAVKNRYKYEVYVFRGLVVLYVFYNFICLINYATTPYYHR